MPLAPLLWFRLGGPAAYFASPRGLDELVPLFPRRCRENGVGFKILAGGSNVLVRDEGIQGLVIHLESPSSPTSRSAVISSKPVPPFR